MNTSRYYQYIFPGTIAFSVVLMLIGLSMGHPEQLLSGLWKIVTMQDLLITDYIHIAGPAAAFVNAGLVTIISILIIKLAKDPFNGFTIVEMGLMAGFSCLEKCVQHLAHHFRDMAVCPVSEGAVFQVCLRGPAGDGTGPVGELYGIGQRPRQLAFRRVHRYSGGLFAAIPVGLHL